MNRTPYDTNAMNHIRPTKKVNTWTPTREDYNALVKRIEDLEKIVKTLKP